MSHSPPASPVDQTEFRKLMSLFATGVCVVSPCSDREGNPTPLSGMTVNSFVSVSLDPMLVCWSLGNASSQFSEYSQARDFTVSILTADQHILAQRYAMRGDSALVESDFVRTPNGLPVIADALGYLECRLWSTYPAGDHTMIFGEVQAMAGETERLDQSESLGFFGGRFCGISQ